MEKYECNKLKQAIISFEKKKLQKGKDERDCKAIKKSIELYPRFIESLEKREEFINILIQKNKLEFYPSPYSPFSDKDEVGTKVIKEDIVNQWDFNSYKEVEEIYVYSEIRDNLIADAGYAQLGNIYHFIYSIVTKTENGYSRELIKKSS